MNDEHGQVHEHLFVLPVQHDRSQIQHNVDVKLHHQQHIVVLRDDIYQHIVQHVANVHVDIIVNDEIFLREHMINEKQTVNHDGIVTNEQTVVQSVLHDTIQQQTYVVA